MLDEPFNGLDPEGIVWMRGFLRSLAGQGRAVLVSSHLMSELEDTADHLVVVGRGKVVADTSMADLIAAASGGRVMLHTSSPAAAALALERAGGVISGTGGIISGPDGAGATTTLEVAGLQAARIVEVLSQAAVPFSEVSAMRASLERAYLDLTRDQVEFRAEPAREVAP
jgi:ABC-2 type transport system ATP-binding protein